MYIYINVLPNPTENNGATCQQPGEASMKRLRELTAALLDMPAYLVPWLRCIWGMLSVPVDTCHTVHTYFTIWYTLTSHFGSRRRTCFILLGRSSAVSVQCVCSKCFVIFRTSRLYPLSYSWITWFKYISIYIKMTHIVSFKEFLGCPSLFAEAKHSWVGRHVSIRCRMGLWTSF